MPSLLSPRPAPPILDLSTVPPLPAYFRDVAQKILEGSFTEIDVLQSYEAVGAHAGVVELVTDKLDQFYLRRFYRQPASILEVGSGTGVYSRSAWRKWPKTKLTIFEIEDFWRWYVATQMDIPAPYCDGQSLSGTPINSVELVVAHGVFTYIKPLETINMLRKMCDVCAITGLVVFDFIPMETFEPDVWLASPHRYAQPLPTAVVVQTLKENGFDVVEQFSKPWRPSDTNYLVSAPINR